MPRISSRDLSRTTDRELQRVLRMNGYGRLGRSVQERFERRWRGFLRSAQPFSLTRPMLDDARQALRRLRAEKVIIGGSLTNQVIDAATIHLVLRAHHRPVPYNVLMDQMTKANIGRHTFNTAVRLVKKHGGIGESLPSVHDYFRLLEDKVPAWFLGRVRELAAKALEVPKFQQVPPNALLAAVTQLVSFDEYGRLVAAAPDEEARKRVQKRITQDAASRIFEIDVQWVRRIVKGLGAVGVTP